MLHKIQELFFSAGVESKKEKNNGRLRYRIKIRYHMVDISDTLTDYDDENQSNDPKAPLPPHVILKIYKVQWSTPIYYSIGIEVI